MSTVADFVKRALKKVGAVAQGGTPTAEEYSDAIGDLNGLVSEWYDEGIDVWDTSLKGALVSSDTFPLDSADDQAVLMNLCERLLVQYPTAKGAQLILKHARDTKKTIRAKYSKPVSLDLDVELTTGTGYNIVADQ